MTALREGLPPLPACLQHLPIDARGYPVPAFVAVFDGVPDHRIADSQYMAKAVRGSLCWICGKPLEPAERTFVLGPASVINRTVPEPPSHEACARYAAMACPYLTRPQARRRDTGLPTDIRAMGGTMLPNHPPVVCLWRTPDVAAEVRLREGGHIGLLFVLGEPTALEWITEARQAIDVEVFHALHESALVLEHIAAADGPESLQYLHAAVHDAMALVQSTTPEQAQPCGCCWSKL